MLPTVSVVIPTYNYAHFINQAISSITHQTYPSDLIEIIVVDDGSKDNTQEVLKNLIDNGIIKYFYQDNQGKAHATSQAIQYSSGKYIFNLDADDFYFTRKIEQTVKVFESDSEIVHVATAAKILHDNTQVITEYEKLPSEIIEKELDGNWLLKYFYHNNILYGGGSTYAARSSILKSVKIPASVDMFIDEFLILAILPYGKSFFINEPLSIWRGHDYNYSGIAKTKEARKSKGKRLLNSSKAILEYLKEWNFNKDIIKIYEVKYLTSFIALKDEFNEKSINDLFNYGYNVFFKIRPGLRIIKRYHVINRFVPSGLFSFLKKYLKRQ